MPGSPSKDWQPPAQKRSAIHMRVRRLEKGGHIQKYVTLVNPVMIGRGLIAFNQAQLKEHASEVLPAFQQGAVKLPEIPECRYMSGNCDFLLRIVISDMNACDGLLMTKLSKLLDVSDMQHFCVLSWAKQETAYPVG